MQVPQLEVISLMKGFGGLMALFDVDLSSKPETSCRDGQTEQADTIFN